MSTASPPAMAGFTTFADRAGATPGAAFAGRFRAAARDWKRLSRQVREGWTPWVDG